MCPGSTLKCITCLCRVSCGQTLSVCLCVFMALQSFRWVNCCLDHKNGVIKSRTVDIMVKPNT